jgi:hypothetical protein
MSTLRKKKGNASVPSMNPKQMVRALVTAFKSFHRFLIVGAPGTAKTDVVTQAARIAGFRLIIFHPVVSDPTDFKGLPALVDGRAVFLPFSDLEELLNTDEPTVVFFDDLGQASGSVQASVMQLILGGKINGHVVSDKVVFVAASNRREDFAAVNGILEPVKSRFHCIVGMDVDVNAWLEWAEQNGLNQLVRAFIANRPNLLHDFKANQDMVNQPSPRTVANAAALVDAGYPRELLRTLLAGCCGMGWATEFIAFMDIIDRMVDPNLVIQAPDKVDVPTDHDVLYVLCLGLAANATERNFNNIMRFCERIPNREFQKLLVATATKRDQGLKNTSGYCEWAAANPGLN